MHILRGEKHFEREERQMANSYPSFKCVSKTYTYRYDSTE